MYDLHNSPGPSWSFTPSQSSEDGDSWLPSSPPQSLRNDASPVSKENHQDRTRNYSDEKIVVDRSSNKEAIDTVPRPISAQIPSPPQELGSSPTSTQHFPGSDVSNDSTDVDMLIPDGLPREETPDEPFFSPAFQSALHACQTIANDTASAIEKLLQSGYKSDDLDKFRADAERLSMDQTTALRTIAIIGDSGEGKSSVINCLLDFPELAKTGDIGEACTSVVTEYRLKTQEQQAPITIEVEYLSKQEIEQHLEELTWSYRNLFLVKQANEAGSLRDEQGRQTLSDKDYERIEREAEHAWSALEAAFGHHAGFGREMLTDRSQDVPSIVAKLARWSQELEWPEGDQEGFWTTTATDADECCEKTSIFMNNRFWPFTKIIRVFVDAPVLRHGVVLADLPGLQDTNLARVRLTQNYLLKSDHVFLVTNIMRAKTDASLRSSLYQALAQHIPLEWENSAGQSLKMAIVCTKIDGINMTTNRREFCGPNKPISPAEWARLDRELEKAKSSKDEKLAKSFKRKQKTLLIGARNRHVTAGLQAAYASRVPGGQLDVFCVSSKLFDKYKSSDDLDLLQMSGIPDLRRFCHSITASARLLQAQNFLRSKLPSLLTSIELWVTTQAASTPPRGLDAARAQEEWRGLRKQTVNEVGKAADDLHDEVTENLFQHFGQSDHRLEVPDKKLNMAVEQRNDAWEKEAEKKGREWLSWHWTQYNAWILRYGDHYTAKRGKVNWNAELIWKTRMELEIPWNSLMEERIPETFEKLFKGVKSHLMELKESAQGEYSELDTFAQSLDLRLHEVQFELVNAQRLLLRDLRLIRRNASEPNGAAYILAEMIPAYRSAAAIYGTGKMAKQHAIVQGRISDGTLFPNISDRMLNDISSVLDEAFHGLRQKMNDILRLIRADLNLAVPSHTSHVRFTDKERHAREQLAQEIKRLQREHQQLLEGIADLA
ncbi:hypothetical protein A1O1_06416 [Capronia coronata CBS 617.96]|uniref:G domain-containing protein n=1 Tax=Capronia coronata CBS 617.96 TaxID=1182541 RepID=W9XZR3_9EURO|nr:uncharacterized protein A1O1_06416 [Capronia coronata CBS 617.96]EXJ86047.1 hypothetical protein A1O1_06416 [Capronia coronata CBS 617.96]